MKFKDMPYERVDYEKTAKKLQALTERSETRRRAKSCGRCIRNIIRYIRIWRTP